MEVVAILLAALLAVGIILRVLHKEEGERVAGVEAAEECCGMHATCEKDSLLAGVSGGVEYFEDEELDRFKGREAEDYSAAETEEFRDVLFTLREDEVAPWGRSLQLRGVELPAGVRDEFLMMVSERRGARGERGARSEK